MKKISLILSLMVVASLLAACSADSKETAKETVTVTEEVVVAVPDTAASAADVDAADVIAKVNGTDITEGDVQNLLNLFLSQMGERIPAEQLAANMPLIRERIIEELVMREIMMAEVAKRNVVLSDAEFAEIKTELSQELPPGFTLEDYMAETGTTEDELRQQMTIRKMILTQAENAGAPSEDEVKAFYEENKEGFHQGAAVEASHILVQVSPEDDEETKAAKLARIKQLRQQLLDGADFAELAKENSDCPSAANGGHLGTPFGRGQMVVEFEDAAFSQPVGEVGDVVETQFGYHLIKVINRTEEKTLEFDEVKDRIAELLTAQRQQDAVAKFVQDITEAADIERLDVPPAVETILQLEVEEDLPVEESLIEKIEDGAKTAIEATDEAMDQVGDKLEVVAEEAVEVAKEVVQEAGEGIAAAADKAEELVKDAAEHISEAAEKAEEAVKDAIDSAKDEAAADE